MSENILIDLTMDFAVKTVSLINSIKGSTVLSNQLLRCGTSIGANIHEANYAQSKLDFFAKLQIALKECYETEFWLELFVKSNIIATDIFECMRNDCGKIRRILISSINTTKSSIDF